jgi:hypothetical protein
LEEVVFPREPEGVGECAREWKQTPPTPQCKTGRIKTKNRHMSLKKKKKDTVTFTSNNQTIAADRQT